MNILNQIIANHTKSLLEKRGNQVLEKLKEIGIEFSNRNDLEIFAKTRCVIHSYPDKVRKMYVDGVYLCEWNDSFKIEHTDNDNGFSDSIKITLGL